MPARRKSDHIIIAGNRQKQAARRCRRSQRQHHAHRARALIGGGRGCREADVVGTDIIIDNPNREVLLAMTPTARQTRAQTQDDVFRAVIVFILIRREAHEAVGAVAHRIDQSRADAINHGSGQPVVGVGDLGEVVGESTAGGNRTGEFNLHKRRVALDNGNRWLRPAEAVGGVAAIIILDGEGEAVVAADLPAGGEVCPRGNGNGRAPVAAINTIGKNRQGNPCRLIAPGCNRDGRGGGYQAARSRYRNRQRNAAGGKRGCAGQFQGQENLTRTLGNRTASRKGKPNPLLAFVIDNHNIMGENPIA